MEIKIADYAGFCFGVQRAMKMACNEIQKDCNIYSLGPLIHNKQAVEKYEERGLKVINDLNDIKNKSRLIIRSHGVGLDVYEKANEKKLKIIDTTCPFVKKIQTIAHRFYKKGYKIIVLGDKNHPEVIGINGWCNNEAIIVKDEDEIKNIQDKDANYCVVAQTTMNLQKYTQITSLLNKTLENIKIHNTICLATKQRQEAANSLAKCVDCMIVVGGRHSSNTQKLVGVCEQNCKTYSIETSDELDLNSINQFSTVGITAGASTPNWIIEDVIKVLENI